VPKKAEPAKERLREFLHFQNIKLSRHGRFITLVTVMLKSPFTLKLFVAIGAHWLNAVARFVVINV
jgi:hypothetical protein